MNSTELGPDRCRSSVEHGHEGWSSYIQFLEMKIENCMTVIANSKACSPSLFAIIWRPVAEQLTRHSVKDIDCSVNRDMQVSTFPRSVLVSRSLYVHLNHDNSLNSFCVLSGYVNVSVFGLYWTRSATLLQNNHGSELNIDRHAAVSMSDMLLLHE